MMWIYEATMLDINKLSERKKERKKDIYRCQKEKAKNSFLVRILVGIVAYFLLVAM